MSRRHPDVAGREVSQCLTSMPALVGFSLLLAACTSLQNDDPDSTNTTAASGRFASFSHPLTPRSATVAAGIAEGDRADALLWTGDYSIVWRDGVVLVDRPGAAAGLQLQPLGSEVGLLSFVDTVDVESTDDQVTATFSGSGLGFDFEFVLQVFPRNPGLIRYQLEITPREQPTSGSILPEWGFVDPMTGIETAAEYEVFADRAPGAAPSFYGYSATLDSTLLYWLDITRITPFIEETGFSPVGTPVRRGRRFGHNISSVDLQRLPFDETFTLLDSYLYLTPGSPRSETEMFRRYLFQVSDIYDMLARPIDPMPDWQELATETLNSLHDPDTWIELDGRRYWRAYVSDTRHTVEAITQLDVGLAAARYVARYGDDPLASSIVSSSLAGLPEFFNPDFGLIQNSGPLHVTGSQERGDTWYEVGHALKAAEFGTLGYEPAANVAELSREAWIDFAETVEYRFPQFYSFSTWDGSGREPDAAGGYALYMLRMADLGCGDPCVDQAKAAVRAFEGYGFGFAYETHMTAAAALAAVELSARTGNDAWLEHALGPIANLIRLSWLYEVDYGPAGTARTFFGLAPTQNADAITPKEQYESWIYLTEMLRLAGGSLDPDVEKLLAEFSYHTLITLADSLPTRLPDGVATANPSAYETVGTNRLDLAIPLEDMREGRTIWGAIGQEVYGAGMAPTFAALAYQEIAPGVVIYGGYPLATVEGDGSHFAVTWAGADGYSVPVRAWGLTGVTLHGDDVATTICGDAMCFDVKAHREYALEVSGDG